MIEQNKALSVEVLEKGFLYAFLIACILCFFYFWGKAWFSISAYNAEFSIFAIVVYLLVRTVLKKGVDDFFAELMDSLVMILLVSSVSLKLYNFGADFYLSRFFSTPGVSLSKESFLPKNVEGLLCKESLFVSSNGGNYNCLVVFNRGGSFKFNTDHLKSDILLSRGSNGSVDLYSGADHSVNSKRSYMISEVDPLLRQVSVVTKKVRSWEK